jgi:hypothetical protein
MRGTIPEIMDWRLQNGKFVTESEQSRDRTGLQIGDVPPMLKSGRFRKLQTREKF